MNDSKTFWLQVGVSIGISLVFGSGMLAVLAQLGERLPEWLYNTFIFTIYIFFVVILLVLVVILTRFAFGDWFKKLRISVKNRRQHHARQKLAEEWYEKWRELCLLLYDVASNNWQPTEEQKNDFSKLRTWFRINRSKFLHIWHSFEYPRRKMAHEYYGSSTSLGHEVFYDNHDDPFSYFYEPLTIEQLEHLLQYHHDEMPEVMLKLKEFMDECVQWVSQE